MSPEDNEHVLETIEIPGAPTGKSTAVVGGQEVSHFVSNGLVAQSFGVPDNCHLVPVEDVVPGCLNSPTKCLSDFYIANVRVGDRGAFGTCTQGFHRTTGTPCVVKSIQRRVAGESYRKRVEDQNKIKYGIQMTNDRSHPNVVRYLDFLCGPSLFFVVMEPVMGLELFDYLLEYAPVTEGFCRTVMQQGLSALCYVHGSMRVIHRDIKPENFRFRDTRNGELVLLDFGLSTVSEPANVIRTRVGTMAYAAPEVHTRRYGTAADVWSIGVMLYVMLTGCVPFEYSDEEMRAGVCDAVTPKDVIRSLDIWELSLVSAPARCLLRSLLVHDARDRWTAVEALQHQWFHAEDALPWSPCARRKSKFLDVDKCAYRSAFDITRKLPDLKAEPTSLRNHTAPGSLPETEGLRRRRPACLVCFKGFVEILCLLCLS